MSAGRGMTLPLAATAVTSLVLGLCVVWLHIERVDLAYGLKELQATINEKEALEEKLLVERDNLMSPYRLRREAAKLGLGPARQGQIRRIHEAGKQE